MAQTAAMSSSQPFVSKWSDRYRGAIVQDLEPPAALSINPSDPVSLALISAFEREYTHLTIIDSSSKALLGYVSIPHLQAQLDSGAVKPDDPVSAAMTRFQRRGRKYTVITMATPLEELEAFFDAGPQKQDFAVVTDEERRFVLGVATREDLEEFVRRRPA
ncbi:hypothetical protein PFICI_01066 [Pestalotiopsis fici W106-1]|uniref:CBS domain-containing protein n=1 Tax=Pestalotiopsis fici (strain W106-1 / CGMCC3.15140) TaxID=1229662 RepID=W3XMI3_PESFW|nr:uncharacterized protein PFICI_01066 [Pestalotiopsis fici W106-1]ETS87238.1 hypothetical protein PFICI_01066 [Pestalotiopsis fici W106-1]